MKNKITLTFFLFIAIISVTAQEWHLDLNEAQKVASKKNQLIILVFQGSDWCAPCIKLDREIWNTKEFIDYSKNNFVMLLADFPRKKKNKLIDSQQQKNNQLMEKYNLKGYFPYVVVLDKNLNVLGSTGYKKIRPSEYIKLLTSF